MPREPSGPAILQLNVEGLTRSKCEVIQCVATKHSDNVKVHCVPLIGVIHHAKHGIATLVRNDLTATLV